jgi:mannose-6-phosphate isomerase-like protein (cupin superfamily)
MGVRRVVTGHDEAGKGVFVSDEQVPAVTLDLMPGSAWYGLWGADQTLSYPDDGSRPGAGEYFPEAGGFRFGLLTLAPDREATLREDLDFETALAELNEKMPGLTRHMDPNDPGMHTTATCDCGIVLSGEATLELDDGATTTLRQGDTFVQGGTRHRFSNRGDVPAVLAVVLIGANHSRVG